MQEKRTLRKQDLPASVFRGSLVTDGLALRRSRVYAAYHGVVSQGMQENGDPAPILTCEGRLASAGACTIYLGRTNGVVCSR